MIVSKIYENKIIVSNNHQQFEIFYMAGDVYWVMDTYDDTNEFVITSKDTMMYNYLNKVFTMIERNNDPYNQVLKENCFTWVSEATGTPEDANILKIWKFSDTFKIKFYQNPQRLLNKQICAICFCLSGSNNQAIANAFSMMLHDFYNQGKDLSGKRLERKC